MRPLARKALAIIKANGGHVIDHDLIDRTLREIGSSYQHGLLAWIRTDQQRWDKLLELEDRINKAALVGNRNGLTKALGQYRSFFKEMIQAYRGRRDTEG